MKTGASLKSKKWLRYENHLTDGEWHIHTKYTDGKNTPGEICARAHETGIPLIVFSEHVRKTLSYSYTSLLGEIAVERKKYPDMIILAGCEAKVMPDGSLDVPDEVIAACDIVHMAFHSFPEDKNLYLTALNTALTNPSVDIWAHPGIFLKKTGLTLSPEELDRILESVRVNNVLLEINSKYNLPFPEWIEAGRRIGVKWVRGSDVHDLERLVRG